MNCRILNSNNSQQVAKYIKNICNEGRLHQTIQGVNSLIINEHCSCISSTALYYLLQECIDRKDLDSGRRLHFFMRRNNYELDNFLGCHLIRMYALCGSLVEANQVFLNLLNPNAYAWSAMILAHAKFGDGQHVIDLFFKSQNSNVTPGEHMYVAVLKTCSTSAALLEGKLVHTHLFESGFDLNVIICNTLINMYAICGCLCDAHKVFERMPKISVVTWNAMIAGYLKHSYGQEALQLYHRMWQNGVRPDNVTIISTLKACTCILAFDQGKEIYAFISEEGLSFEADIVNSLIDMSAKCGSLHDAVWLFNRAANRDVVTWSAMIAGYVQHGSNIEAFHLFHCMLREGVGPDIVTYSSILKASSNLEEMHIGMLLHAYGIAVSIEQDAFVGSTLIDMYAKGGSIEDARRVFERLTKHNVVTWGALIAGYAQYGYGDEVLELFLQMKQQHIVPNSTLHVSLLMACASITLLTEGKLLHRSIIVDGHEADTTASSSLIDMYAKCGSLKDAAVIFNRLPKQTVGTWTALITGFAQHNDYMSALKLFTQMQTEGLRPNSVTFASLLSACSHMGLADEGCSYFDLAKEECANLETQEHFNCVIDLMGRTGRLNEAEILLQTLPSQPHLSGWMSLLSHCRMHGDVSLGRRCFNTIMLLNETHAAAYMLMSSIYVNAGMMEDARMIHELEALMMKHSF